VRAAFESTPGSARASRKGCRWLAYAFRPAAPTFAPGTHRTEGADPAHPHGAVSRRPARTAREGGAPPAAERSARARMGGLAAAASRRAKAKRSED